MQVKEVSEYWQWRKKEMWGGRSKIKRWRQRRWCQKKFAPPPPLFHLSCWVNSSLTKLTQSIPKKKKNFSKIFKDRWHQFQEKFNFGGKKIKFQRWSRTKGIIFQKKKVWNSKFQISNFKGKISFQRTTKIDQGFPSKKGNSSQRKEKEENHTSQNSGTTRDPSFKV